MRFEINLASQPYQDVRRLLVRWGPASFVALLVTVGLMWAAVSSFVTWRATQKHARYFRQKIDDRDRQRLEVEAFLNRPENRQTRDRSEFLNALFARKAFSWTEVFTDLEEIVPGRLRVVSLMPQINQQGELELHLRVSTASTEAGNELVRRLERSSHFTNAQILNTSMGQTQQNQSDSVHFEISAVYIPAFARERSRPAQKSGVGPGQKPSSEIAARSDKTQTATEASNARR